MAVLSLEERGDDVKVTFGDVDVGVVSFIEFGGFPLEDDSAQGLWHHQSKGEDSADNDE